MKKYSKIIMSCICLALALGLAACASSQKNKETSQTISTYSNLNSKKSVEEVKNLLAADLDKDSVDNFVNLVNDYNGLVGSTGLKEPPYFATPRRFSLPALPPPSVQTRRQTPKTARRPNRKTAGREIGRASCRERV